MDSPRFQWRRLSQFRIRTLLILMAVLAALLGWWSWKVEKQRKAVEALTRNGPETTIYYFGDSQLAAVEVDGNFSSDASFRHWRYSVVMVDLRREIFDSDIAALQALDALQEVCVDCMQETKVQAALPHCKVSCRGLSAAP